MTTTLALLLGWLTVAQQGPLPPVGKPPPPEHQVLFELFAVRPVYEADGDKRFIVRVTNCRNRPLRVRIPYTWEGCLDWFSVRKDGAELPNTLERVDFWIPKITVLQPRESATIVFSLDEIVVLPDPQERPGTYTVRLGESLSDGDNAFKGPLLARDLQILIARQLIEPKLPVQKVAGQGDAERAQLLLRSPTLWPSDRVKVFDMLIEYGHKDVLWAAFASLLRDDAHDGAGKPREHVCADVFAVVTALGRIPKGLLDVDGLFALAETTDLALRRAALQALGRLGRDPRAADRLARLLESQEDEYTLEIGRAALAVMRGAKEK